MTVRNGILGGLRSLAVLLCVILVSWGLWWGLAALGDHGGSAGARGVALVAIACFFIDVVGLVVLLAICELRCASTSRHSTSNSADLPASTSADAD